MHILLSSVWLMFAIHWFSKSIEQRGRLSTIYITRDMFHHFLVVYPCCWMRIFFLGLFFFSLNWKSVHSFWIFFWLLFKLAFLFLIAGLCTIQQLVANVIRSVSFWQVVLSIFGPVLHLKAWFCEFYGQQLSCIYWCLCLVCSLGVVPLNS